MEQAPKSIPHRRGGERHPPARGGWRTSSPAGPSAQAVQGGGWSSEGPSAFLLSLSRLYTQQDSVSLNKS